MLPVVEEWKKYNPLKLKKRAQTLTERVQIYIAILPEYKRSTEEQFCIQKLYEDLIRRISEVTEMKI